MIKLDEYQDRILRDLARAQGEAEEKRVLARMRFVTRAFLTFSRLWDPKGFEEWDKARIAEQEKSTAWMRRS